MKSHRVILYDVLPEGWDTKYAEVRGGGDVTVIAREFCVMAKTEFHKLVSSRFLACLIPIPLSSSSYVSQTTYPIPAA